MKPYCLLYIHTMVISMTFLNSNPVSLSVFLWAPVLFPWRTKKRIPEIIICRILGCLRGRFGRCVHIAAHIIVPGMVSSKDPSRGLQDPHVHVIFWAPDVWSTPRILVKWPMWSEGFLMGPMYWDPDQGGPWDPDQGGPY